MSKQGFDNDLYVKLQTEGILKRIEKFSNKLYLEFGGKLFDDFHAARVLPGFDPNVKIKIMQSLKDKLEMVFVIAAPAIERNKMRADFGITYGMEVVRLIEEIRKLGIYVSSIAITQYENQPSADTYINKLIASGEKVYIHRLTKGYPSNINVIVSEEGYGANPYIETTRPLVIITAPGPASGKLATCLSQLYHEYKRGVKAGYAKFETFPVWNLPIMHPVNIAYEIATADIEDSNMIDTYHLGKYGFMTVNYNRDVETLPILKTILEKITGNGDLYSSTTDMGVNEVGNSIIDEPAVNEASVQEIIRRYYKAKCEYRLGTGSLDIIQKIESYLKQIKISIDVRLVVKAALEKAASSKTNAVAIMINDGIITGKQNRLMSASASTVLNAVKTLAGIPDDFLLLSPAILEPILKLKADVLDDGNRLLNLSEVLLALSICAATDPVVNKAFSHIAKLKGCEAHSSVMLDKDDDEAFRKLGINLTCEPNLPVKS